MPVREAMERIDAREFAEWVAYWALEPWGEKRADLRAGIVSSTVANALCTRSGGGSWQPSDFMPEFDGDEGAGRDRPQTVEEMRAILRTYVTLHNSTN